MLKLTLSAAILAVFVAITAFDAGAILADQGGTKGKSPSNPDGNGADKPVAEPATFGGAASQGPDYFDGNNGCGQDRRYDVAPDHQGGYDDNNGHCGKPAFAGEQAAASRGRGQARAALNAAAKGVVAGAANGNAKGGMEAGVNAQAPAAVVAGQVVVPRADVMASAEQAAAPPEAVVAGEQQAPDTAPAEVPTLGGRLGSSDNWTSVLVTIAGLAMSAGAGLFLLRRLGSA